MTLIRMLSSRLPASAPRIVPWPPRKPTPPSTAAAIAVERERLADQRIARAGLRGDEEAGEGLKQAADDIGAHARGRDVDAGAVGALGIVADRDQAEPKRRRQIELPQNDEQHEQDAPRSVRAGEEVGQATAAQSRPAAAG